MIMTKLMSKRDKIRAQMKSRFYYWFWGATAVAVVGGQLYVGSSYRAMAKSMNRWFDTAVEALIDNYPPARPRGLYEPLIPPPTGDFRRDQIDLTGLDPDDYIIWLEVDEEV